MHFRFLSEMTTNDSTQIDLEMDLEKAEVQSAQANVGTIPKVDFKKDLVSGKGGQLRLEATSEEMSNE